jgi:hypothetical protein
MTCVCLCGRFTTALTRGIEAVMQGNVSADLQRQAFQLMKEGDPKAQADFFYTHGQRVAGKYSFVCI